MAHIDTSKFSKLTDEQLAELQKPGSKIDIPLPRAKTNPSGGPGRLDAPKPSGSSSTDNRRK